jgi:hypothetical protein
MKELSKITKWSDISIEKYVKLYEMFKNETDEIEILFNKLMIIYDLTYAEVEEMPLTTFKELSLDLAFMEAEPNSAKFKKSFKIDKVQYTMADMNSFKLGEWVDLEHYSKDLMVNIHRVLAILYRTDVPVDNKAELLNSKLDCETALSAFFFFYLFALSYIPSDIQGYSMLDKTVKNLRKMKKSLKQEPKEKQLVK